MTVEIALASTGVEPAEKDLGSLAVEPRGGFEIAMRGFELTRLSL